MKKSFHFSVLCLIFVLSMQILASAATDTTAPTIFSLQMNNPGTTFYYGDTVSIEVFVEDKSEISSGLIKLSDGKTTIPVQMDSSYYDDGTRRCTFLFEIDENIPASFWTIQSITLSDVHGNVVSEDPYITDDIRFIVSPPIDDATHTTEYVITAGDVVLEDGDFVVDVTYSIPQNNNAKYTVGIEFDFADSWGGFGLGRGNLSGASANIYYPFSVSMFNKYKPAGIPGEYRAYIELEDTEERFFSDSIACIFPGENAILREAGTCSIPPKQSASDTSKEWIEYHAETPGQHTITLTGACKEFDIFTEKGRIVKHAYSLDGIPFVTLDVTKAQTYYFKCTLLPSSDTFALTSTIVTTPQKVLSWDANGGNWQDSTPPTPYTLYREYDDIGWGESGIDFIEISQSISNPGYAFVGWNTKADGSGTLYLAKDVVSYTDFEAYEMEDITLFAMWVPISAEPSVVFNTWKGSFSLDTADAEVNEIQVQSAADGVIVPNVYREGYSFIGWCDSNELNNHAFEEGGLSKVYFPGEEIVPSENLVLCAQWIENSSSDKAILFHPNAPGIVFSSDASYDIYIGDHQFFCENHLDLEREGYILLGWNTAADGTGQSFGLLDVIDVEEAFPDDKVITLYAQWEQIDLPDKYFVFVLHEETFENGQSYLIVDRSQPFELPVLEDQENAPFIGWKNSVGVWGPVLTHILLPGENISFNKNAYLYPVFSDSTSGGDEGCWLFVDANGGYIESNSDTLLDFDMSMWWQSYRDVNIYNERVPQHLPLYIQNMHREGFTLTGLNTKSDGTGTQYALDGFVPSAGLKTVIYAQWELISTDSDDTEEGDGEPSGDSGGNDEGSSESGSGGSNEDSSESGSGGSGENSSENGSSGSIVSPPFESSGGGTSSKAPSSEKAESPTTNAKTFNDVTADYWAASEIAFVVEHGLFNGISEDSFAPDTTMTRQMLMTVLARLDGADTSDSPYAQGMAWAVENGISDGADPAAPITRQQLATMLWRYAGSPMATAELSFPDTHMIANYATLALRWAVENGIMNGTAGGHLNPTGTATRAHVAAMVTRFANICA